MCVSCLVSQEGRHVWSHNLVQEHPESRTTSSSMVTNCGGIKLCFQGLAVWTRFMAESIDAGMMKMQDLRLT